MSDDTDERLIKPPVVVESYGDLDGKSRSAIRQAAATGHVEVLANRVRSCARLSTNWTRTAWAITRRRRSGGPTI